MMFRCGGNERLNTVPLPKLPPKEVVPYRMLPDKINPPFGLVPSLGVKLCRVLKPVPLVLTANTVPNPEPPPENVVPCSVPLAKSRAPFGEAPSIEPVKLYRVLKLAPSIPTEKIVPCPEVPP